jgi:hypothetical protein
MTPRHSALLSLLSLLAINSFGFAYDINAHLARHVELNKRQATGLSFTLHSTNPTAVPLSSINPSEPTKATTPLKSTPTAGSVPSGLTGASGLPDGVLHIYTYLRVLSKFSFQVTALDPSKYPTMDKVPPIDSDEVKAWIQEVQNSGITVPGIAQTNGVCQTSVFLSHFLSLFSRQDRVPLAAPPPPTPPATGPVSAAPVQATSPPALPRTPGDSPTTMVTASTLPTYLTTSPNNRSKRLSLS